VATVNASLTGQPTPPLRRHIVEFIRGVGLVTDGVIDATTTTGPWTWVVPSCSELMVDACSAGAGGAGGASGTGGGGGGGGGGLSLLGWPMNAYPGQALTVTIGQKGTGGAIGAAGGLGGNTSIAVDGTVWKLLRASSTAPTAGTAANGGSGGHSAVFVAGPTGGTGVGGNGALSVSANFGRQCSLSSTGAAGGAPNFSGGQVTTGIPALAGTYASTSTATGTSTLGGGGAGAQSPFGIGTNGGWGGLGGNGGVAGTSAPAQAYGGGGGGGGGNAAGGDGADGYVRITYYAQD
jgi:hypothetical protein